MQVNRVPSPTAQPADSTRHDGGDACPAGEVSDTAMGARITADRCDVFGRVLHCATLTSAESVATTRARTAS